MKTIESSKGFVLIIALIACIILSALAVLVITLSTGDLKTTVVILGGKKATAAVESGYHILAQPPARYTNSFNRDFCTFAGNTYVTNCTNLTFNTWLDVDAANMQGAQYRIIAVAQQVLMPPVPPYTPTDVGFGSPRFVVRLEGRDRTYSSTTQIDAGIAYGPVFVGTGGTGTGYQ
jgi:hypothetical protein